MLGSLTFLEPMGLLLFGLTVPLVLLYVLKSKRRTVRVPSIWLWADAKRSALAETPFQKLRARVPLILEALAILFLSLAFAHPVRRAQGTLGDHVALIVDVSASMAADASSTGGETRLDRAKERARELVRSAGPGSQFMIIAAGRDARVASPLDGERARLLAAIDSLAQEDVEGDLGPALGVAVGRIARASDARIVVVTDGDLAHPESLEGVALPVEVITVGDPAENLGIVRVDVRTDDDPVEKRERVQAFLLLQNSGTYGRDVYVTMREDNASDVLASRRVLVAPGEKLPVILDFFPAPGDHEKGLVFDVSPHDHFATDDVAYGRVPPEIKQPVVLLTKDGMDALWLARAFSADPSVSLAKASASLDGGGIVDKGALIVACGLCPANPPGGDLLIVDPPPGSCHGVSVGDPVDQPSITWWEKTDRRLRFVDFDGVAIAHARKLTVADPRTELLRSHEGPLIVDASSVSRNVTIVGFDVGESDWPLKASFVLFVRDILEEARAHRAHGLTGSAVTGEPLLVDVPQTTSLAFVTRPGERAEPSEAHGGRLIIPDVMRVGLYRISTAKDSGYSIVLPVNLTSATESNLSKHDPPSAGDSPSKAASGPPPLEVHDYGWLLGAVALLLLILDVMWVARDRRSGARTLGGKAS